MIRTKSVLTVSNLNKTYGTTQAVNNLNLEVPAGSTYGILGPNGSGKTTTLGMILNIIRPTSGSFQWFEGTDDQPRKRIGAILETPNFYPYLSAAKNLELVASIKGTFYLYLETIVKHKLICLSDWNRKTLLQQGVQIESC